MKQTANLLFASSAFTKLDPGVTLPAKFNRLLDKLDFENECNVKDKLVAIKMHVGRGIGYTTIHPLFVKALVERVKRAGGRPFITDQSVDGAEVRGYTPQFLGCPVVDVCGITGKYFYHKTVNFKKLKDVDVAGHIHDADVLIDLSHVKGHGCCGFGGAVKNIAMGCVTDRTRGQIHSLEGGLTWDESKCTHCEACIINCNHQANSFDKEGQLKINFHHCTYCQHCVKVCPTGAIVMDANHYKDFQTGMALSTQKALEHFAPENTFYINFLTNMTIMCDCWGFTTPNFVPDAGILAGKDIVAIEKASLDMIKVENFIPGSLPVGQELTGHGHLIEQIHGKDPFVQLEELEEIGMGTMKYTLEEIE